MPMHSVRWRETFGEPARLAIDSIRLYPARAGLAISGIVVGIVTVVLVASTLANIRNQVALQIGRAHV